MNDGIALMSMITTDLIDIESQKPECGTQNER